MTSPSKLGTGVAGQDPPRRAVSRYSKQYYRLTRRIAKLRNEQYTAAAPYGSIAFTANIYELSRLEDERRDERQRCMIMWNKCQ